MEDSDALAAVRSANNDANAAEPEDDAAESSLSAAPAPEALWRKRVGKAEGEMAPPILPPARRTPVKRKPVNSSKVAERLAVSATAAPLRTKATAATRWALSQESTAETTAVAVDNTATLATQCELACAYCGYSS